MVVVLALAASACGSSGRELRDPEPGATAPPRRTSSTTTSAVLAPIGLSIVSPAWAPGDAIPRTYSCDGDGESPPLTIGGATDAAELVVVVTDPVADGRVHWVDRRPRPRWRHDPGRVDWRRPPWWASTPRETRPGSRRCPPPGETHTYEFTVYAMPDASGIDETTPAAEAVDTVSAESDQRRRAHRHLHPAAR